MKYVLTGLLVTFALSAQAGYSPATTWEDIIMAEASGELRIKWPKEDCNSLTVDCSLFRSPLARLSADAGEGDGGGGNGGPDYWPCRETVESELKNFCQLKGNVYLPWKDDDGSAYLHRCDSTDAYEDNLTWKVKVEPKNGDSFKKQYTLPSCAQ